MEPGAQPSAARGWRERTHEIIFEADTPAGRAFDIGLIAFILASVLAVMLDSIEGIRVRWGGPLNAIEWVFTTLFTVEYIVRLACVNRPARYARSFFGVIDLLGILPTYLSLLWAGSHYLLAIRVLRVLRIFRVLKLTPFVNESRRLATALRASGRKIFVFLFTVLTLVVVIGSAMYVVEGGREGFSSIPRSIYWAIVTLTTVGYGDISPQTPLGQTLAAAVMILGYSIIAVPTGIVTAELASPARDGPVTTRACPDCGAEGHDHDAHHCKFCGGKL